MSRLAAPRDITPPVAEIRPTESSFHGKTIHDNYAWLKDAGYPEVETPEILSYLKEENAYFEKVMSPQQGLIDTLFNEIKGRIKDDDYSVPWQDGKFDFRWAFEPGAEYRTWYYRPRTNDPFTKDDWQTLYDEAVEGAKSDFFKLKSLEVSPCGCFRSASVDRTGGERFTVEIFDLQNGKPLELTTPETSGEIIWDTTGTGYYYVEVSREWRPFRVMYQSLSGDAPKEIYKEDDTQFFVHIGTTGPKRHLIISSATHITSEIYLKPLDDVTTDVRCVLARRDGHEYSVAEGENTWYILSNRDHVNFGLYKTDNPFAADTDWQPLRMGNAQRYLRGLLVQANQIAVEESLDGQQNITLLNRDGSEKLTVDFPEDMRGAGLSYNPEFNASHIRLHYTSMITPASVFDLNPETGELTLRKVQEIPSGYNKDNYRSERLMVTARDGVRVPVSLVYHKDWKKGTDAPLHLYGYGAYGLGMTPGFSAGRLSLLDRGFAYAIAHIRGGDEMGYDWYQSGKLEKRENTFNDFVDVAKYLVTEKYSQAKRITISGGSAGGELMGAVVNQAGDLFAASVLHVPFVDVLNTMLDESLPLTPMEWPEWGNPITDASAFDTIQNYCPYTNIEAKDYPPMMVTGGLNDPRVTYWEPAKWTAKLRATKTDDHLLVMKINMEAGHGGKSGRYQQIKEIAEEYAFCLMATGKA